MKKEISYVITKIAIIQKKKGKGEKMAIFISIFIILIYSIFLSIVFKRKIDETLKIGVLEIILLIYIPGLFDNLRLGALLVKVMAIIQLACVLFILCKQKEKCKIVEGLKRIFTPGLLIYIILCFIFTIINKGRIFTLYDEFNHWAIITKNMYMYNTFGTNVESIVTFNEYPPLTAIFQYFFLSVKGVFCEETIITAHNILYFSVIITIMKNVNWDKSLKKLLGIVPIVVFLPMIFIKEFYLNILVDGILGILFAIAIYEHYERDENLEFRYIKIFASLLMLSLIKTSGIALAILSFVIILIKIITERKYNENLKKELIILLVFTIITALFISAWYLKINNVQKEWDFSQYIKNDNKTQEQKNNIIKTFWVSIFLSEIITDKNMTIFLSIVFIVCTNFYILSLVKESRYKYYSTWMIISIPLFLIGCLISYIAIFIPIEAQILACIDRYISTVLIANLMFQFLVLFRSDNKINCKTYLVICAIIMFLLPIDIIEERYINGKKYKEVNSTNRAIYTKITKYKDVLDEKDSIFYIVGFQNNMNLIGKMNQYAIMPARLNKYSNGKFATEEALQDEIPEESTHIFVYRMENEIKENVKNLFENSEVKNDTLYKIIREDDKVYFERVEY